MPKVREVILKDGSDSLPMNLIAYIAALQALLDKVPDEYKESVQIDINSEENWGSCYS